MTSYAQVNLLAFCFVCTIDLSTEGFHDYLDIKAKDLDSVKLTADSSFTNMIECTLYNKWANDDKSDLYWYLEENKSLNMTVLNKMCSRKNSTNESIRVFLFKCLLSQLHNLSQKYCEGFETAVKISNWLAASGQTPPTHTPTMSTEAVTSTTLSTTTKTPIQSAATPTEVTTSSNGCTCAPKKIYLTKFPTTTNASIHSSKASSVSATTDASKITDPEGFWATHESHTETKTSHVFLLSVLLNVLQLTGFLLYFWHQKRRRRDDNTHVGGEAYECINLNLPENNPSSGAATPPDQGTAASDGSVHSGHLGPKS